MCALVSQFVTHTYTLQCSRPALCYASCLRGCNVHICVTLSAASPTSLAQDGVAALPTPLAARVVPPPATANLVSAVVPQAHLLHFLQNGLHSRIGVSDSNTHTHCSVPSLPCVMCADVSCFALSMPTEAVQAAAGLPTRLAPRVVPPPATTNRASAVIPQAHLLHFCALVSQLETFTLQCARTSLCFVC